jgi:hypothetical protein
MLLVATAPEGGEDIMHMDKPELRKITEDPNMPGLEKLVKLFFAPSESSQAAGEAFAARLAERDGRGCGVPEHQPIVPRRLWNEVAALLRIARTYQRG